MAAGTPLAEAFVRIRPKTDTFERDARSGINRAGRGIAAQGDKHGRLFGATFARATVGPFRSIIGLVGGPLLAGFATLAGIRVFAGFIAEAREAGRVTRLTENVIRSTGGAANVTAGQVAALADRLSNATAIDDELVQTSANLLLTFKNVRNELGKGNKVFDRATAASLDLSASGFGSVDSAAKMLGKALNDPLKGLTALGRAGVTFTQQQKDQIKTLVEAGDVLGAQRVILQEVESQVGGAAKAAADPMQRLGVVVNNLKERLGVALLPALTAVASFISDKVVPAVGRFVNTIGPKLQPFIKQAGRVIQQTIIPALRDFAKWAGDTLGPILANMGKAIQTILPPLITMGAVIATAIIPVVRELVEWISRNQEIIPAVGIAIAAILVPAFIAWAVAAGAAAIATIAAAAPFIIVGAAIAAFAFLVIKNFDTIKNAILTAFNWVKNNWPLILAILTGPVGLAVRFIIQHWEQIKATFTAGVRAVVGFLKGLPGQAVSALASLGRSLLNVGLAAMKQLFEGHRQAWGALYKWLHGLPRLIVGALGNLGSLLFNAGRQIIQGLINGVKSLAGSVGGAIKDAVSSGVNAAKDALGIGSPSKVFAQIGRDTMRGYAAGLEKMTGTVERSLANVLPVPAGAGLNGFGAAAPISVHSATSGAGGGDVHFHFHGPVTSKQAAQDLVLGAYNQLVHERKIRP